MGLYDRLTFKEGLDIEFPGIGADPCEEAWQTKSISRHHPMMDNYKITVDGRLFEEEAKYEQVPEEERPNYDEEIGGFESPMMKLGGSQRRVHLGWTDTEYHGTFEFHRTIDGGYVSLEAKFTDGQLVEVIRND